MITLVRNTCLGILLLCSQWGQAQKEFHFETYTNRNGLSHNDVRAIIRDKKGFLWIGTANGLNRFDGHEFKAFLPNAQSKNALRGASIMGLAEDPQGRIWVTHNQGLDIYLPQEDHFTPVVIKQTPEVREAIRQGGVITIDQDGRAIVTFNHHLILILDSNGKQYTLTTPEVPKEYRPKVLREQKGNKVYNSIRKSDHEVWLATDHGLFSLHTQTHQFTLHPLKGCDWNFGPKSLYYEKKRERMWMSAFGTGFYYYEILTQNWKYLGKDLPVNDYISDNQSMAPFGAEWVFFNTPGLYNIKKGYFTPTRHIPDDPYSFPLGSVSCAYTDHEGILWIGTTSGLTKLDPRLQGFKHEYLAAHPEFPYDNSVFDIFFEPKNQKLYATSFYCGGVYEYDLQHKTSFDLTANRSEKLAGTCQILRDSRGITWLSANSTLYEIDLPSRRFSPVPIEPAPKNFEGKRIVPDLEEDAEGNIWLAMWHRGPLVYERKRKLLRYVEGEQIRGLPNMAYNLCASRSRQHIWLCTLGEGVWQYDSKTWKAKSYTWLKDKSGKRIDIRAANGIECDQDDRIWIATIHGLVVMRSNGELVQTFTEANGLTNSHLEGMGKDLAGRFWLATASGISMVDPRTLEVRNFDERHGLKLDATLDGFSVLPNGEVCAGTKRGFIRFHPDTVLRKNPPLQARIIHFRLEGQNIQTDWLQGVVIKPKQKIFSITYAAPNYTLPEETRFSYFLQGHEQSWSEPTQNQTVTYSSVPPGEYKFCLKVRNKDGIWSKQLTTLPIVIRPPFWRTPWFVILLSFCIAGIVYAAYRLRAWQIRKEERMKAEFNKRLAEVEMAALRSQMNPHFLFNCLNSINRFIQRNEPDAASVYLTKFSRLIRLVLDNSRSNLVTLRDEMEALRLYLELESMRFVDRFKYKINISPHLDTTAVEIPPMIIQPYVENAIWHGLMHKENKLGEESYLEVRVFIAEKALLVEVEDNGIGREAARALKSKSATTHKSHGMTVTAERIQMINQIYQIEASIMIEDLVDPSGKPTGTKVKMTLPME